jgi:hypothetical protein
MKAARLDLLLRPGATFIGRIFICLDANGDPVDLTGYLPFAQVRLDPLQSVLLDLHPSLVATGQVVGNASVSPPTDIITLASHGLMPGNAVQFSSSNTLPTPLDPVQIYIVLSQDFSGNTFSVCLLSTALTNNFAPIDILDGGTGSLKVSVVPGQILMPEITDEDTEQYQDADAGWDLMLEDPAGRRLAAFVEGKFTIKRGYTDPYRA